MASYHVHELDPPPINGHPPAITQTIILLHGRDSTAEAFADDLFESEVSEHYITTTTNTTTTNNNNNNTTTKRTLRDILPTTRWVFPNARLLPSARFQCDLSQWFDIWSTTDPTERAEIQTEGLVESMEFVAEVVRRECRHDGGRWRKVYLGGISQGFATVVAAVLSGTLFRGGDRVYLDGLVGLCSWMPPPVAIKGGENEDEDKNATSIQQPLRVFLAHALDDDVVPVENGRILRDGLVERGMRVTWCEYGSGGHWVNEPQGIEDLVDFLAAGL